MSVEGAAPEEVQGATKPQVALEPEGTEEDGCGYSFDHDIPDVIDGTWTCRRCGAEGWDDEEDEA